ELPDGTVVVASVLLVDGLHGLALLAPVDALTTESFAVATQVQPGDELSVLGDPDLKVSYDGTDASSGELPESADVPEGAPVLNQRGELVALCTHDADGTPRLLTLSLLDTLSAMIGDSDTSPVWIGIVINDDPTAMLTVGAIDPEGPAARAGLRTGDVVVAVDGVTIADCDALVAVLAAHQPGDVIVVTVRGADGLTRDLKIELAEPKTAI
ncbi:MAG TPA: S1C family serine protease, partial [Ilumatobacteraceae bacterium]|nr:S1C family serine protease [Ilumatobacteraceae bacterium]